VSSRAAITVCFVARSDFESKPGGDTVQWRMYERAAREAGIRTTTWFDDRPPPAADVFHAFNVDRPLELYPRLREVRRRGLPFVLSTIHHPNPWIVRFRRAQPPTGFLGRLLYSSRFGRSVPTSEPLREAAILLREGRLRHVTDLRPSWSTRAQWLLEHASRVAFLSRAEEAHVRDDIPTARSGPALLLPNWVEDVGEAPDRCPPVFAGLSEPPVLVVGRIEPRKNSVRIARLAVGAQRPVVFVGRPHPTERRFVEAFQQVVRSGPQCHWVPGVARAEMAQFYAHAAFLLNASLVEVSPLVDIEALSFGCPIVTTRFALHHELLPPDTRVCDPYDDDSITAELRWRPQRSAPRHVVDPTQCRRELVQAYRELAR
jgi:glycosyltransferase involved in cell wall biosynthesis